MIIIIILEMNILIASYGKQRPLLLFKCLNIFPTIVERSIK